VKGVIHCQIYILILVLSTLRQEVVTSEMRYGSDMYHAKSPLFWGVTLRHLLIVAGRFETA
jgi:hypothetical protein